MIGYYLGIDFGTSGARACAIDSDRLVVWERRIAYGNPDMQAPADWRSALHTLLSGLPGHIAAQLRAVAVDGTSGTVLLCDSDLTPVSPALLYNDTRAQQQAAQLKNLAPEGHAVCSAGSGLAKLLWLTRQGIPESAACFMHQADWLAALLSGQAGVSDYHNALKTGYDIENLCWPEWILALPNAHLLPGVLAPGAVIGRIKAEIAAHFGINPECGVCAGTTDSTAAFIASGVHEAGIGVTSLGSTLVLKQLSNKRIEAPEYGVYSHRYGDLWLAGGASNAGAAVLRQFFDDAQLAALSQRIDPLRDSSLDYYPLAKAGERFPVNDARLAPRMEPRPASDVEFLHGLLQGLTRIEKAGYERLAGLGAPPLTGVVTTGGGAKNKIWGTMRERLLGVPVGVAPHSEAAYGVALLSAGDISLPRKVSPNKSMGAGLPNR